MCWLFGLLAFGGAVTSLGLQIPLQLDGIPESTFDELMRFTKFSSAVYQLICPSPLGTTLVDSFYNIVTDAHGFVARDDDRHEIIVAFRGTQQLADVFTDENLVLVPFSPPGVQLNTKSPVAVHAGFLIAFNSISRAVISSVREQLDIYNNYSVIATGDFGQLRLELNTDSKSRPFIGWITCLTGRFVFKGALPDDTHPAVHLWYSPSLENLAHLV
ncbi:hypothetical protein EWM64_g1608 [Hericium alpestre]|uniref:Fungal lipase-type domain-containing protein n=1 Tax=Hericium alpestre TaxID=135208 RepID=A0A4Z0A811_9AGAM|nr:hypothetical protein EWM64_g1608 [Hericium alpestre]